MRMKVRIRRAAWLDDISVHSCSLMLGRIIQRTKPGSRPTVLDMNIVQAEPSGLETPPGKGQNWKFVLLYLLFFFLQVDSPKSEQG